MKAIALAAGLGTRLRPYTDRYAKPALPVLNAPLLHWAADLLKQAGATELVVNACYKQDQIESLARFVPGFPGGAQVSIEAPQPLGAGGGVWKARRRLEGGGSFWVANGDEVILPSSPQAFARLRETHAQADALATIFAMRHPLVGGKFGGVWTDASGRVAGFGKTRPAHVDASAALEPLHYVGLQIVSDRVFAFLPEGESNLLYDALAAGIAAGERVQAVIDDCEWHETGNPSDFVDASIACVRGFCRAEAHFALRRIAEACWPSFAKRAEVAAFGGARAMGIDGSGDWPGALARLASEGGAAVVGDRCAIEAGASLKGACAIGDRVVLQEGCEIEDCVVLPGTVVVRGSRRVREIVLP